MSYFINGQYWYVDPDTGKEIGQLFHGFVGASDMARVSLTPIDGYMWDRIGQSSITEFQADETGFQFLKQYRGNEYEKVFYRFGVAINDVFPGYWEIRSTANSEIVIWEGVATCMLTETPDLFFRKPKITK